MKYQLKFVRSILLASLVAVQPVALLADTLLLKTGRKYENVTITGMDREMIRFTEKGARRSIAKRNLEKIIYSNESDQIASIKQRDRELAELQKKIRELNADPESSPENMLLRIRGQIEDLKGDLALIGGIEEPAEDAGPDARATSAENPMLQQRYNQLLAIARQVEELEKVIEDQKARTSSTLEAQKIESELTGREIRHRYAESARQQRSAIWRSMVLPGWGHVHTDRTTAGITLGALFLGGLGYAVASASEVQALNAQYNDPLPFLLARSSGNESQALLINAIHYGGISSQLNAATARYNGGLVLAGAVWAGALFHISLADLTPSVRLSLLTVDPARSSPGLSLSATIRW